ncbi:MAG: apolipoprotein N-acyltransferase [Parafilimonas sp.]|nr:apolipoprotein N-acyltransferase [Parafilimonas sp.]
MLKKKLPASLLAMISGLLAFIAIAEINFIIGLICFVPLFISILNANTKQHFKQGLIFGFVFSCFTYSWMISGAERFTGYNFLYGAAIFLVCAFIIALYWACLLLCISFLKIKNSKYAVALNSIAITSLFCVFEFCWSFVGNGLPWFNFYAGTAFEGNLYAVQPASFFGIYILSFIVVLVNYLIAVYVVRKYWKRLVIPSAIILIYLCCGYIIFQSFNNRLQQNKVVKIAIANENIPPDIKWDDANGNMLVQRLLDLNKAAVALHPDIILWSESAVPWTYRKDDDLVNEILKESSGSNITHILGINTEVDNNIVNNSAYCFLPGGNVANRYDKQFLLSFIEKPLSNFSVPFFSSKGFFVNADQRHNAPLQTPYGKAGIMICNESAIETSAQNSVKQDANFFCNMSNDGWFNNTYIVRSHFLGARLRAVETRKDVAVNCNNGYSGFINANGNIIKQEKDTEPFIQVNNIYTNNYKAFVSSMPLLFIYVCAALVLFIAILKISTRMYK